MEGGGDRDDVTMMIIAKIITDNEFEDFTDQILTKLKLAVNVRDDSDGTGYDEDCDGDNACDDGNDDVGDVEDGDDDKDGGGDDDNDGVEDGDGVEDDDNVDVEDRVGDNVEDGGDDDVDR